MPSLASTEGYSIPHGRGGEPRWPARRLRRGQVFPTGVGVNRLNGHGRQNQQRIPHGRGGEPGGKVNPAAIIQYSPRAWG